MRLRIFTCICRFLLEQEPVFLLLINISIDTDLYKRILYNLQWMRL